MKALLIGGSGYIGRYAARYLSEHGISVKVFDIIGPGHDVNFISGDIRDIKKIKEYGNGCDAIVIMAGVVGDPACEKAPRLADELNHLAVRDICNLMPGKHIILLSTCGVYGAQDGKLHEGSSLAPISIYARTKVDAENHIVSVGGTVFRLGSVYGVGDPLHTRLDSIINLFVMKAVKEGRIKVYGGEQWKSVISVKDIAGYLYEAIREGIRGTFNIASESFTVKDIAMEVSRHIPVNIEFVEALANDRNYKVDSSKLRIHFSYECQYDLSFEIDELINLFKNQ
jgi:nucleoside-diphosphate-sugar epimerase